VPVNLLKGEQLDPTYLAHNPAGLVPTLKIGDRYVGESLAIIEWLDETWPAPALFPEEPLPRLHARQLALIIVAGTQPLQNPGLIGHFVKNEGERKAHVQHFITRGLETYSKVLAGGSPGRYCLGDAVSVADLCLIPQIYNAKRFDVAMAKFPRLAAIYDNCLATPACDQAAPHNQPGATGGA
jgi:maleylacetoacetate isomerase